MLSPLIPLNSFLIQICRLSEAINYCSLEREAMVNTKKKKKMLDLCQVVTQVMLWMLSIKHFNGILFLQINHAKIKLKTEDY